MNPRNARTRARTTIRATALGGAILAGGMLIAPSAASAAIVPSEGVRQAETVTAAECQIVSSELTWGVKERFRTYISGSIANGGWTTDNGASYETPNFLWNSSEGRIATDLGEGELPFTGSIQFTGHDGLLRFDLSDPTIEIDDAETAYLLLSIGATDTGSEGAPEIAQVRAAKIDLTGTVTASGDRLSIDGAVPLLTAEGASAFNGDYGSYVAGEELDPISLEATVEGCELGAVEAAPAEPEPAQEPAQTPAPQQEIPWIPIVIGAVALLVIGLAGGMLIAGRSGAKKNAGQDPAQRNEEKSLLGESDRGDGAVL